MAEAEKLYKHSSNLSSYRMHNRVKGKSMIRIMNWESISNDGLGYSNLKVVGSRWATVLTENVFNLANHVEDALLLKKDSFFYVSPQRNLIQRTENFTPFESKNPCVHEMLMLNPLTRLVAFQRNDYQNPQSGFINHSSHFKASEIIHAGLIVNCDPKILKFYEEILGLIETAGGKESEYVQASRNLLSLKGPENKERMFNYYYTATFSNLPDEIKSGNIEVLLFDGDIPNKQNISRPGSAGFCLYTLKVNKIENFFEKIQKSMATEITSILKNEFGEKSFSFIAPDGYFWTLVE